MAIAFKPTRGLNAFALQYVNSQCQHDSLPLKLPAKIHLLAEPTKSPTDYFGIHFSFADYFESTVHGLDGQRPALTLHRKNVIHERRRQGNFASKRAQRGTRFPLPSGSKFAEGNDDILNNFGCALAIRASSMAFGLHKLCSINAASQYHSPPAQAESRA